MNIMSKIQFEFNVECNLRQALSLAIDIVSEMRMIPTFIINDGKRIQFDEDSAMLVMYGTMSEQDYIQKYIIV